MAGRLEELPGRLANEEKYRRMFAAAFPEQRAPITVENITRAIASFERSIVSAESPVRPLVRYARAVRSLPKRGRVQALHLGARRVQPCHAGRTGLAATAQSSATTGSAILGRSSAWHRCAMSRSPRPTCTMGMWPRWPRSSTAMRRERRLSFQQPMSGVRWWRSWRASPMKAWPRIHASAILPKCSGDTLSAKALHLHPQPGHVFRVNGARVFDGVAGDGEAEARGRWFCGEVGVEDFREELGSTPGRCLRRR